MSRYLEYVYLLAGLGIAGTMAVEWKHLPTSAKIGLGLGCMLCAFMYSFRKKQREMMDELDRREEEEAAQGEGETEDKPHGD